MRFYFYYLGYNIFVVLILLYLCDPVQMYELTVVCTHTGLDMPDLEDHMVL